MNGKDYPVAFSPSIDKNLLRDLDRHFRAHLPDASSDTMTPEPETLATPSLLPVDQTADECTLRTERPTADNLVIAVQRTAAALTERNDRIEELERDLDNAQRAHTAMSADLKEARQLLKASGDALQEERQYRDRAEELAAHHVKRTEHVEAQLAKALNDFNLVADAIAGAGLP